MYEEEKKEINSDKTRHIFEKKKPTTKKPKTTLPAPASKHVPFDNIDHLKQSTSS